MIVLAIGGNEQTSREAWKLNHMGDRTSLDLIGRQEELVDAMVATGKPVVVLLFNGRPLSINYVSRASAGDFRMLVSRPGNGPRGGRLFVRRRQSRRQAADHHSALGRSSAGILQLQAVGAARLSVRRRLAAVRVRLWFELHDVRLRERPARKKKINRDGSTRVLVDVTNTGTRAGAEVVQMYIRDLVSSVTRPIKELKGFQKVALQPGETKTVAIDITPESLAFYDVDMKYVVEPGEFEIMVGNSSRDADLQKVILTVAK